MSNANTDTNTNNSLRKKVIVLIVIVVALVAVMLVVFKPWASGGEADPGASISAEDPGLVVQDEVVVDVNIPDDEQTDESAEE